MACKILSILPKTPVSAIGVNFCFVESDPNEEILVLFDFRDNVEISTCGWDIGTTQIVRRLTKDGMTLNLKISQDTPSKVLIDANFHYPVKCAEDASERIKAHTVEMQDNFLELIKKVYSLTNEEETHD
jgi:hypothetical protein